VRAVCSAGCAAAVVWLAAIVGGSFGFGRLPPAAPAALVLRGPIVVAHAHRLHARPTVIHRRHRPRQRTT
jgi:hypothetical protein